MEIVGSVGGADDLDVRVLDWSLDVVFVFLDDLREVIAHQLEESLNSSARVLWSLSIHAVGEIEDETGLDSPFTLS